MTITSLVTLEMYAFIVYLASTGFPPFVFAYNYITLQLERFARL